MLLFSLCLVLCGYGAFASIPAPRSLSVTSINTTSIGIKWDAPLYFEEAIKEYHIVATFGYNQIIYNVVNHPVTSFLIGQLFGNNEYTISVAANTVANPSTGQAAIIKVTTSPSTNVNAPRSLTFVRATTKTIDLSWMPPRYINGTLNSYRVIAKQQSEVKATLDVPAKETSCTLQNLSPNTQYTISVDANTVDDVNNGLSTTIEAATWSSLVSAPLNLVLSSQPLTNIAVKWTQPSSIKAALKQYRVRAFFENKCVSENVVDPTETSFTIEDLSSKSKYTVVVDASTINDNTYGEPISKDVTTLDSSISAPQSLIVTSVTQTSISVSWKKPGNFPGDLEKYQFVATFRNNEFISEILSHTTTSRVIDGLSGNNEYIISVAAKTAQSPSFGTVASMKVSTLPSSNVSPPQSLTFVRATRNTIVLTWMPPKTIIGALNTYRVIAWHQSKVAATMEVSANEKLCTFKNLKADTQYTISVDANTVEDENYGESARILAETSSSLGSAPRNLASSSESSSSIRLGWGPSYVTKGIIKGYRVRAFHEDKCVSEDILDAGTNVHTIEGLIGNTDYTFLVDANNVLDNNYGEFGKRVGRTLAAPLSAPRSLTVSCKSATSIDLRWEEPTPFNGKLEEYRVVAMLGADTVSEVNVAHPNTSCTIEGLTGNTEYAISVAAKAAEDPSLGPSANITEITLPSSNGGLSGGAIAGIVIGTLALILLIILIIVLVLRRGKTPKKEEDTFSWSKSVVNT